PRGCLYHGDPERAQVQRVAWRPVDLFAAGADPQPAVDLLTAPIAPAAPPGEPGEAGEPGGPAGGFRPSGPPPGLVVRATALAVDPDEHLFVLDGATGAIHVLDLADGHLVRTIELGVAAVDLAADGQ